nr:DUF6350 family protein [Microbacterium bovistercoris]
MQRLLIVFLAAFDAVIAAAVGIAVVLAPLTLLWVVGIGAPDWSALWPATGAIWQLGHLVPLAMHLPTEYLAAAGIPEDAASFSLSLAPLALAGSTAVFAARSGARAGRSGHWAVGVLSSGVVFAAASAVIALTARTPIAAPQLWQAVLLPTLVYLLPSLAGAVGTAWRDAPGLLAQLRHALTDLPGSWPEAPALMLRGAAVTLIAMIGLGALTVVGGLIFRGDEVIALFQAGNFDAIGVIVVALAQLAYLPTLVLWGAAFLAGPGFAVGAGTAVSPAGTQLGVVPGLPVLGALPESASPWLLALVLLPIAAGALAGWMLRARLATPAHRSDLGLRAGLAVGVAALSAAGAALLGWLSSGAIGPGRLAEVGPQPGPFALAFGLEVLVGAAIILLTPQRTPHPAAAHAPAPESRRVDPAPTADAAVRDVPRDPSRLEDENDTAPIEPVPIERGLLASSEDETDTAPIDPGFLGRD